MTSTGASFRQSVRAAGTRLPLSVSAFSAVPRGQRWRRAAAQTAQAAARLDANKDEDKRAHAARAGAWGRINNVSSSTGSKVAGRRDADAVVLTDEDARAFALLDRTRLDVWPGTTAGPDKKYASARGRTCYQRAMRGRRPARRAAEDVGQRVSARSSRSLLVGDSPHMTNWTQIEPSVGFLQL